MSTHQQTNSTTRADEYAQQSIDNNPVEARIIRKIIRALKSNGTPVVNIYDGVERVKVSTEREAMLTVFNLDEAYLVTDSHSWVRIVLGNEWYVLTDHTLDLSDALASVEAWIEANEGR